MNKVAEISEFMIASDEDGEHTSFVAFVFDDQVELSSFVHKGDTETAIKKRVAKSADRFERDASQQKFFAVVELHQRGKARPLLGGSTPPTYEQRGKELALQAAEDLYDKVWPIVGQLSQKFVDDMVAHVNLIDRLIGAPGVQQAIATGAIDPIIQAASVGDLLRKALFAEENEFLAKGAITQKIGFVTERGGAAMIPATVPYEKYRWGRSVAEIARQLNARKIIQITDAFGRDSQTGERNGEELLLGFLINPDGSVEASAAGTYEKRGGRVRVKEGIHVIDKEGVAIQEVIPAWELSATIR
jgi:hypothetical protein